MTRSLVLVVLISCATAKPIDGSGGGLVTNYVNNMLDVAQAQVDPSNYIRSTNGVWYGSLRYKGTATVALGLPTNKRLSLNSATDTIYVVYNGTNILLQGAAASIPSGVTSAGAYTSTVASGNNGFACTTAGCRMDFGPAANDYLHGSGGTVQTPGDFTAGGTQMALDYRVTGTNTFDTNSHVADGTTAYTFDASTNLTTGKHSAWRDNGTTELANLSATGIYTANNFSSASGGGYSYAGECDSRATPGNATCNQFAGHAAIDVAATTVVITNSNATANSGCLAVATENDATCVGIKSCVPASGTVTIEVAVACTAATNVFWSIHN